jgi:hypothetical protein
MTKSTIKRYDTGFPYGTKEAEDGEYVKYKDASLFIEKCPEAWDIIDDFAFILFINNLHETPMFFTVYKRAMEWLKEYETE